MYKKSLPFLVIALLPLLMHAPIWMGRIDFFSGDGSDLMPYVYGTKLLQYQAFHNFGEIPFWNPYFFFGQPVIGNIQYSHFYPLNLFFLLFPFFSALWLYNATHMVIAGLGAYLLARHMGSGLKGRLLAGCLFMLNGRLLYYINAGWVDHFGSICWLPFILLWSLKTLQQKELHAPVWMATALAMSFLAGTPQYALLAICLFALQWLHAFFTGSAEAQRFALLFRSLLAGLLFALLISIQLLPTFEQAGLSSRVFFAGESHGFHFNWDINQWFRIFLRPELLRHDYAWDLCAYIGIGGLTLTIPGLAASRRYLVWAALWGLIPFLISLGPAFPPAGYIIKSVPGMSLLTSPSRYLIFTILVACILAGKGLEKCLLGLEQGSLRMRLYLALAAVVLSLAGLLLPLTDPASVTPVTRFWISLALFFAMALFYAWRKSILPQLLLVGWLVCDPLWLAGDILSGYRKSDIQPPSRIISALKAHPGTVRIATLQPENIRDNLLNPFDDLFSAEYRLRRAGGYDPLAMLRSLQYLTRMDGTGNIREAMWGFRPWAFARPELYDIAGITHLVTFKPFDHPRLKLIAKDTITMPHFHGGWWQAQPVYLYENKGVLPRAFFRAHGAREPVTAIALNDTSPDQLHLTFETKVPGLVVISESYHSGWRSAKRHRPVAIKPFLNTFISFRVDPGAHDILLEFSPRSYRRGRWLSLAGLLLSGMVLLFGRRLRMGK